jgi:hypothetical protein
MSDWIYTDEALAEKAKQKTGLSDFGSEEFREGLSVLCETFEKTAGMNEAGRKQNWKRLEKLLELRLKIQAALTRHPEIREREIHKPFFLTGLPRTGTSALFNLLGMDPATRPLLLWESFFPDPIEGHPRGEPDPRYLAMKAANEQMRDQNKDFSKIHFTSADTPEECVLLMAATFEHVHNGVEVLMEPYKSFFEASDMRRPYAWYKDVLKLLDWQRPGDRWLLKSPAHLWALDVLVEQYPDCCVILTHRNLADVFASYCSMMNAVFAMNNCTPIPDMGVAVLDSIATSLERGLEARERTDPSRFIDIRFDDFADDNMATVEKIYAHFELPFDEAASSTMASYVANNPKGKHGKHEYDLEQYGLSLEMIRDRLGGYADRYELEIG